MSRRRGELKQPKSNQSKLPTPDAVTLKNSGPLNAQGQMSGQTLQEFQQTYQAYIQAGYSPQMSMDMALYPTNYVIGDMNKKWSARQLDPNAFGVSSGGPNAQQPRLGAPGTPLPGQSQVYDPGLAPSGFGNLPGVRQPPAGYEPPLTHKGRGLYDVLASANQPQQQSQQQPDIRSLLQHIGLAAMMNHYKGQAT